MVDADLSRIGAVVLAAGMSRRMGQPKMVLTWGNTTVLGQVVHALRQAGLLDIVVVTGADRELVETLLVDQQVKTAFNENYQDDHMLLSLQVGIRCLDRNADAALVVLGDQPQLQPDVIRAIVAAYFQRKPKLLVPSFQNRRGHPWLIDQSLWPDLLLQLPPLTLRQWLRRNSDEMDYLLVNTDSIFRDLDTPDDYQREKPD